jgi:hypothetical protein
MSVIHVIASKKQISDMKRGKAVRVKPANEGCGFAIIVHHGNGKKHELAIRRGKGHQLQLSAEELQMNKDNVHHLHGKGIYEQVVKAGKAIVAGTKSAAKALYSGASYAAKNFEPAVMAGAEYGVDAGLAALAEAYPQYKEVIMRLKPLGKAAAKQGVKYVGNNPLKDKESQEQMKKVKDMFENPQNAKTGSSTNKGRFGKPKETNVGGSKAPDVNSFGGLAQQADLIHEIGKATGSDLASRTMAGIANTLANQQDALNTDMEISKRKVENVKKKSRFGNPNPDEGTQGHGLGLYGGGGLGLYAGASRGSGLGTGLRHHSSKHAIVGTHGGFMHGGSMNPALLSQPFSSHFAWKNRLPPAYQRYIV